MRRIAFVLVCAACGSGSTAKPEPERASSTHISLSERVEKDAGVKVDKVEMGTLPATVELTGEVAADPDRTAKVPVRVAGRIVEVRFQEGQRVTAGQVLATIESGEVARVRAELTSTTTRAQAAHQRVERLAKLVEAGTATPQDLESARAEAQVLDADVAAARQTLSSIGGGGGVTARLQIRAPFAGVVTKRDGVIGQPVGADHVLAEIVDLDHALFLARLFEHDLARVHEGASAHVELDAYPGVVFPGKVITIGRQVEPVARAVLSRIAIDDRDARLKIGLFGTVLVVIPDPSTMPAVPIVPATAVTQIDEHAVVFVEVKPREFEIRAIETGHATGGKVEIVKGLTQAERVATAGVFTLKSLALKSHVRRGGLRWHSYGHPRAGRFAIGSLVIVGFLLIDRLWHLVRRVNLPIDAVPDVTNIQVQIITPAPALSPVEVEQYVTVPVERAMAGIPKTTEIRSISKYGISVVTSCSRTAPTSTSRASWSSERMREAQDAVRGSTARPRWDRSRRGSARSTSSSSAASGTR